MDTLSVVHVQEEILQMCGQVLQRRCNRREARVVDLAGQSKSGQTGMIANNLCDGLVLRCWSEICEPIKRVIQMSAFRDDLSDFEQSAHRQSVRPAFEGLSCSDQ